MSHPFAPLFMSSAIVAAFGIMFSNSVSAYETHTHAYMGSIAYNRSVLSGSDAVALNQRLGLDRLDETRPFFSYWLSGDYSDVYFDNLPVRFGSSISLEYLRIPNSFEFDQIQSILSVVGRGHANFPETIIADQGNPDTTLPIRNWLVRGVIREDDLIGTADGDLFGSIMRVYNHFYDPIHNAPLPLPPAGGPANPALEWAMGVQNALIDPPIIDDQRRNHFTWVDAHNQQWLALTGERGRDNGVPYTAFERAQDAEERIYRGSSVFRSLGTVLHLVQDMAQPQHTRIDPHSPFDSAEQQAYEPYTNARLLGPAAVTGALGGEAYVRGFFDGDIGTAVPRLETGNYPIVRFSTPRKYYTTRTNAGGDAVGQRGGMADYSNRGFFTAGTIPPNNFPDPPQDLSNTADYETLSIRCRSPRLNGVLVNCTKYLRKPLDVLNPGYADPIPVDYLGHGGKIPMVTDGLFADASILVGLTPQRILTVDEFQIHADFLIPRAIAYSAGLIDFFFRGKIAIEPPPDGLFALTDQSIAHTVDADGYPRCTQTVTSPMSGRPDLCRVGEVYGFTVVSLKLRNDTTAIVESGPSGLTVAQNMATTSATPSGNEPRLQAVARYHRNACYQPTLSGEKTVDYAGTVNTPTCTKPSRTNYQDISVSKPAAATAANLNGAVSMPVTFDFSADPIPINATDVVIQVVYRGPLGDETDGIAVGSFDVREPTYLTVWNNSDFAGCNGAWVNHNVQGCDYQAGGTTQRPMGSVRLCIGAQLPYVRTLSSNSPSIGIGGMVRLAALLDDQPHTVRSRILTGITPPVTLEVRSSTLTGQARQAPKEQVTVLAPYQPDSMFTKRGIIGSFRPLPFYLQIGADPQPITDTGPNDVGALTPAFDATQLATTGGLLYFPDIPAPPNICGSATIAPFFEDEKAATAVHSF